MTPLRVNRVEEGRHSVEIVHEGYERFATTIEVRANNAAAVDARLIPLKSSLRVTSHPDSAVVILNGERKGVTPLTLYDIPVGSHALVLEKSGCRSYSGTATVAARTMSTAHGELTPITSILRVRVIPSGFIYVNKERRTEDTNATYSTELLPGRYEITAVSLTWGRWVKSVAIGNDAEQEITFDFTKEYRVTVTSDPAYAKVYVNDTFTGKYTPSLLTLRPGQRKIEVRLDGYELRDKPVAMTLESDQTEPIHFTLNKKPGP